DPHLTSGSKESTAQNRILEAHDEVVGPVAEREILAEGQTKGANRDESAHPTVAFAGEFPRVAFNRETEHSGGWLLEVPVNAHQGFAGDFGVSFDATVGADQSARVPVVAGRETHRSDGGERVRRGSRLAGGDPRSHDSQEENATCNARGSGGSHHCERSPGVYGPQSPSAPVTNHCTLGQYWTFVAINFPYASSIHLRNEGSAQSRPAIAGDSARHLVVFLSRRQDRRPWRQRRGQVIPAQDHGGCRSRLSGRG